MPIVIAGRVRLSRWPKKPVPYPDTGSSPRWRLNTSTSSSPNQNDGIASPTVAMTRMPWSAGRLR
jgi:hypothetical protein